MQSGLGPRDTRVREAKSAWAKVVLQLERKAEAAKIYSQLWDETSEGVTPPNIIVALVGGASQILAKEKNSAAVEKLATAYEEYLEQLEEYPNLECAAQCDRLAESFSQLTDATSAAKWTSIAESLRQPKP